MRRKKFLKALLVQLLPWLCGALVIVLCIYGEEIDQFFTNLIKRIVL